VSECLNVDQHKLAGKESSLLVYLSGQYLANIVTYTPLPAGLLASLGKPFLITSLTDYWPNKSKKNILQFTM
jgi:hypothetical protein